MLAAAPAETLPAWMPSRSELLLRPLESGTAIDPYKSYELDDSVSVELLSKKTRELRAKVHIPDASLLASTTYIEQGIEKGWSEYYEDGGCSPLFDEEVTDNLSLQNNITGLGVPTTTWAVTLDASGNQQDTEVYQSRLICTPLTYAQFAKRVKKQIVGDDRFVQELLILEAGSRLRNRGDTSAILGQLAAFGGDPEKFGSRAAKRVVSEFMLAYNKDVPRFIREAGNPLLFRNHHMTHFDHPDANIIREIYPDTELFAQHDLAWYSRIPTAHKGLGFKDYCHASSPLRRIPDTLNSGSLVASINGEESPYSAEMLDEVARLLAEKVKILLGLVPVNSALEAA